MSSNAAHPPEQAVPTAHRRARRALLRSALGLLAFSSLLSACNRPPAVARLEVSPTITGVVSGYSYVYVLIGPDRVALVDAGSDPSGTAILEELARRGLGPEHVEAILITHGHLDHWAAAALFPAATVYAHDEAHRAIRGDRRVEGFGPRLEAYLTPRPPVPQRIVSVLPRTLLEVAGYEVDVIPLPGHTRGSVAFLVGEVLFTGDSLQLTEDGVDAAPASTSGDREENLRSLRRLEGIPFRIIADSHHGVARDGAERFQRWLATQP